MLPTEAFAEAVAFLRLFDLKALAVANTLCSSLAVNAFARIRWEEFPGLLVGISDRLAIFRSCFDADGSFLQLDTAMTFPSEKDLIEFVAAAFPNCIFEDVTIFSAASKHVLDAIRRVAGSVVVKGALRLPASMSSNDSFEYVRNFRQVKALQVNREVSDDDANKLANFYRGSGAKELRKPKRLLVGDAFKVHTSEDTKKVLKALKLHSSVITGGCTRFIQPADVSWNKPFKELAEILAETEIDAADEDDTAT